MGARRSLLLARTVFGLCPVPAQSETIRVTIEKMAFSPAEVKAKGGDTIEWVNRDIFLHSASVKGGWDLVLRTQASGSVVVREAGTIDYYCRYHPNMTGRIVVAP